MPYLKLTGRKKYVLRMEKHLKKEHPSTRRRMKVCGIKKKESEKKEHEYHSKHKKKSSSVHSFLENYRFS